MKPRPLSEVPDGWDRPGWLWYLRKRADDCDEWHQDRADELRRAADKLEAERCNE